MSLYFETTNVAHSVQICGKIILSVFTSFVQVSEAALSRTRKSSSGLSASSKDTSLGFRGRMLLESFSKESTFDLEQTSHFCSQAPGFLRLRLRRKCTYVGGAKLRTLRRLQDRMRTFISPAPARASNRLVELAEGVSSSCWTI